MLLAKLYLNAEVYTGENKYAQAYKYSKLVIDDLPMMTGIQAEGACPIVNAFNQHTMKMTPVENPETVATAIRIGAPVSSIKALHAIYDSNGFAQTVSDDEILAAQLELARKEGVGVEPASAASIAGVKRLVNEGEIDKGEKVVCIVTGHLLKDPILLLMLVLNLRKLVQI